MSKKVIFDEEQIELIKSILEEKYNEKICKALSKEAYEIKEIIDLLDETPTFNELKEALIKLKEEINNIPWEGALG